MSSYNFNDPTQRWLITGNRLRSSNNTLLKIDASGSSSNIRFSKNDASLCVIGTNVDACSNSVLNSCALSVGSSDFSNNTNTNTFGAYYSFGETNTQLAFGSTATRTSTGRPGYIRYNTDDNGFEFWNVLTSSWATVTTPTPTFTSISPNYVPEDSSFNYTVTGANFANGAIIQFISVSGGITYSTAGTTFISTTQLQTRNTLTMSNDGGGVTGAGTSGYKISITNPTGTNFTSTGAVLTYNQGPLWITAVNANLGTGLTNTSYTYATSPFSDLSAVDTGAVIHNPVKFFLDPSGSTISGAASITLDPSGRLIGTTPNVVSSTTYNFNAYPLDASGALGPVRQFAFTVIPRSLSITPTNGSVTTSFVNSSNVSVPSATSGGSTIYTLTSTNASTTGTFSITTQFPSIDVSYLVIAGGGGGGGDVAGAGGAGGYIVRYASETSGGGGAQGPSITFISGNTYTAVVGRGGARNTGNTRPTPSSPAFPFGGTTRGSDGTNSSISGPGISTITATGGGGGGAYASGTGPQYSTGNTGGSGGGGGATDAPSSGSGGTATPSPTQGYAGGGGNYGPAYCGGGGGGAGGLGTAGLLSPSGPANLGQGGAGGNGLTSFITGSVGVTRAGGGGGSGYGQGAPGSVPASTRGPGGTGGGGDGGYGDSPSNGQGQNATINTGSGGGGGSYGVPSAGAGGNFGGDGANGIIILRIAS